MADTPRAESKKKTTPYLPFKTFLNSLDTFSQGLPTTLDRTIWKSQAGLMQGLIMNTYRFLGLVDEYDSPSEELYEMVTHSEKRPAILRGLLERTYGDAIGTDLTSMTPRVLEDLFVENFAVTGATKQKAITFFLKAARFANITLSPFLTAQIRNTPSRRRRAKARESVPNGRETPPANPPGNPSAITHRVSLLSGGVLTVSITANPFKMPQQDRDFVFSVIDKLQQYEQEHPTDNVEDEETNENEEGA